MPELERRTILRSMRHAYFAVLLVVLTTVSTGSDWLTYPSTYSHDPVNGQRTRQYAPIESPTAPTPPNFRTSGYTHTRSQLNFGGSIDNYHRVEEWGEPVRPYGEWQRPFRPYSVPYSQWGPPFLQINQGLGRFRGGYGPPLPPPVPPQMPGPGTGPDRGGEDPFE